MRFYQCQHQNIRKKLRKASELDYISQTALEPLMVNTSESKLQLILPAYSTITKGISQQFCWLYLMLTIDLFMWTLENMGAMWMVVYSRHQCLEGNICHMKWVCLETSFYPTSTPIILFPMSL